MSFASLNLKKNKILIGGVLLLVALLVILTWLLMVRENTAPNLLPQKVHYYGNPSISVEQIRIKAFYVVPKSGVPFVGWRPQLEESLKSIGRFHRLQFLGKSSIEADIYPEPVVVPAGILNQKDANGATLEGVRSSVQELIARSPGDFTSFVRSAPNEYVVTLFLVEGENSGVRENIFVFPRAMLTGGEYRSYADALLYHHFAQTLGIPDLYDEAERTSRSEGIMGFGKFMPIELNFLQKSITRKMGLLE